MSRCDDGARTGSKVVVLESFRGRRLWLRDLRRRKPRSVGGEGSQVLREASKAARTAHDLFHRLAQQPGDPATIEMFSLFARISLMQTTAIEDKLGE